MACDAQTLWTAAKCFGCLSEKQLMAINAYLGCQIVTQQAAKPKVYRATLTQSGAAAAPVATVLENTFTGTPVWTAFGVGEYRLTLAGQFTAGKTFVRCASVFSIPLGTNYPVNCIEFGNGNYIDITMFDSGGTGFDDALLRTAFEILVYP